MTRRQIYAVLLCLVLTALSCAHLPSGTLRASRLAVNGIVVGSTRSAIIKRLGAPSSAKTGYDDIMGMGEWEELTYPGLLVEVIRPESGVVSSRQREFYATSVVVTGRSWRTACGLRVGDSVAAVRQMLGVPERVETGHEPYWYYATAGFDGRVVVTFRDDHVIEIRIEEDWT